MEGWYSTKCALTWKILGIKSRPLLFLRARSMPCTNESEFGLLPTPTVIDGVKTGDMTGSAKMLMGATMRSSGQQIQRTLSDAVQMEVLKTNPALALELASKQFVKRTKLPTQEEFVEWIKTLGTKKELATTLNLKLTTVEHWYRTDKVGFSHPSIQDWEAIKTHYPVPLELDTKMTHQESIEWQGMLPTPSAFDCKNGMKPQTYLARKKRHQEKGVNLQYALKQIAADISHEQTGKISQLNPRFVAEMMGFPPNWTELPFLNGEPKA